MRRQSRRIVLLLEGGMEAVGLGRFLHKWLDVRLGTGSRVGLDLVDQGGKDKYLASVGADVHRHLKRDGVVAVFGLLDLYNLSTSGIDFRGCSTTGECVHVARKHILASVPANCGDRFFQHFAVHETEAWLLSCRDIFPGVVRPYLPRDAPERVNSHTSPARQIAKAYRRGFGNKEYDKKKDGRILFNLLDPEKAAKACEHLRLMLDNLLDVSKR